MKIYFWGFWVLTLLGHPTAQAADGATSAAVKKPTIVLVHGAWGGGWVFKDVGARLAADGYRVYRPTLTGLGERIHLSNPDIDLSTHIADIVNVILWEDLHDVVLLGHSYGGAVISGVADRVPDRIRHLIYLDAAVLNDGESCDELWGGPQTNIVNGFVISRRRVQSSETIPYDAPHPAKTFSEHLKLQHPEAVKKIPGTYVLCVPAGRKIEQASFLSSYERAKTRAWKTLVLESDHFAQWSHPEELVELIEKTP